MDYNFDLLLISELDQIISSLENVSNEIKDGKIGENTIKDLWKISKQLEKLRKNDKN
jgi:hypothetical protein